VQGEIEDDNEKYAIAMDAAKVYDTITSERYKGEEADVRRILAEPRVIVYTNRNDENKILSISGRNLLIEYTAENDIKFKESANP